MRSGFEFLQKVFLGLMYPFSCVLWAIFWSFSLLFFVRQPAIFLITEAKMPQKLIPNHRTINSKQLLLKGSQKELCLRQELYFMRYVHFVYATQQRRCAHRLYRSGAKRYWHLTPSPHWRAITPYNSLLTPDWHNLRFDNLLSFKSYFVNRKIVN